MGKGDKKSKKGKIAKGSYGNNRKRNAIKAKLKDGYLVNPQVSVSIEARVRRTVTVLGQAQNPGVFELPADRKLTVVEAIGMAGGATRIANTKKITLKSSVKRYSRAGRMKWILSTPFDAYRTYGRWPAAVLVPLSSSSRPPTGRARRAMAGTRCSSRT